MKNDSEAEYISCCHVKVIVCEALGTGVFVGPNRLEQSVICTRLCIPLVSSPKVAEPQVAESVNEDILRLQIQVSYLRAVHAMDQSAELSKKGSGSRRREVTPSTGEHEIEEISLSSIIDNKASERFTAGKNVMNRQ